MVSTHLPQSVGISSWPRHRCTTASLRRTVARRAEGSRFRGTGPGVSARRRRLGRSPHHIRRGVPKLPIVRADDEAGGLTAVGQDYLKVIWNAQEWSVEKVSTKMLADRIGVSASTASE